jgi:O-acetyl-ADP-ribose deacetylase
LHGCQTGEAKITQGYRLKARHVIHTVGPVYSGTPRDAELLAAAVRSSLRLADEHHLASIAFPAISTGVYGYPLREAAHVILGTIATHLAGDIHLEHVIMCLYDRRAFDIFDETLAHLTPL